MHDPEKSDSGIVATKPTNKAGRPVAEPVEPRPGTKGNADQQSTHRAQSRARARRRNNFPSGNARACARGPLRLIGVNLHPVGAAVETTPPARWTFDSGPRISV